MTRDNCPMCAIACGRLDRPILLRDEGVLAFLSLHAIRPGHALIVPVEHVPSFHDLPDDVLHRCLSVAKTLAAAQVRAYNPLKVLLLASGVTLPEHCHFHLVPQVRSDDVVRPELQALPECTADELIHESSRLLRELESSNPPMQPTGFAGG